MSLLNKVALVTGASSGIGAAIAIKLSQEGAKVAIVGRNETKLKKVSEISEKQGTKPFTISADVTKDEDAKRIVSETINLFGKLDILINNAGIVETPNIEDENFIDVYDKLMSTNLRAAVYLTHLAAKHLIETKGNIVNISSSASKYVVSRNFSLYSTTKAGLDHFSRCIALELAPKGVRVNTVNPGPVKTNVFENAGVPDEASKQIWENLKKGTALNRVGEPEEIADLVAFLVSDKARSITGASIVSDNGAILKGLMEF